MSMTPDPMARFDAYGARIDEAASRFLDRNDYAMYGMMRYFMGYADETFAPRARPAGKRFRPGLLLAIADDRGAIEGALPAALSIEIFHNFTLIHDDIVDRDETRRGRPTVWKLWGTEHAINTGDAQLVLALLALEEGDALPAAAAASVRKLLLARYLEVAEGQYLDFSLSAASLGSAAVTESAYLTMIGKKSAALVAASAQAAGMIASCSAPEVEALGAFGFNLGMSYQLHDDLQSLWGDAQATGKGAHGDLRERKKTLPILRARDELGSAAREEFVRLYDTPAGDAGIESRLLELVEATDARAYAEAGRDRYKSEACARLPQAGLSQEATRILSDLAEMLVPSRNPL